MTFLPFLVLNLLLASFAAHFAFRFLDSDQRRRLAIPAGSRHARRER